MNARRAAGALLLVGAAAACGDADPHTEAALLPPIGASPLDPRVVADAQAWPGVVYFVELAPQPRMRILAYDAGERSLSTVFSAPEGALLLGLDSAPHRGALVLSYIPPPGDGGDYLTAGLFVLEPGGSEPELLLWPGAPGDLLGLPDWGTDALYYVRLRRNPAPGERVRTIERHRFADGVTEPIVPHATEPAISPDGHRLVYVRVDPTTGERTLVLADPDGRVVRTLVGPDALHGVARPAFGSRSDVVYFASSSGGPTPKHAGHGVAVDWWVVAMDGGPPERAADVAVRFHDACVHPDGSRLVFSGDLGLSTTLVDTEAEPAFDARLVVFSRAIRAVDCVAAAHFAERRLMRNVYPVSVAASPRMRTR